MKSIKEIPISDWEISLMKRDITDYILKQILHVQDYSEFKYRYLIGLGLRLKFESSTNVTEDEEGVKIELKVSITIPHWLIVELTKIKKARLLKLPKPHPLTKQKIREMEETAKRVEEELREALEEYEKAKFKEERK